MAARALALALIFSTLAPAQLPRRFYAWWSSPVVEDLKLSPDQRKQIRATIREYHSHLLDLRTQIDRAEADLEVQFNQEPVDRVRANEAIARLSSARGDLTKTLSEMSLRLRTLLTQQQWQELQNRRPLKGRTE